MTMDQIEGGYAIPIPIHVFIPAIFKSGILHPCFCWGMSSPTCPITITKQKNRNYFVEQEKKQTQDIYQFNFFKTKNLDYLKKLLHVKTMSKT